jgi:hypothetical protein
VLGAFSGLEGGQLQLNPGTSFPTAHFIDVFGGDLRFLTGTVTGSTNERMRLNFEGNLGIDVTVPIARLHVSNRTSPNDDALVLRSDGIAEPVSIEMGRNNPDFRIGVAGAAGQYSVAVEKAGDVVLRTENVNFNLLLGNGLATEQPAIILEQNVAMLRAWALRDIVRVDALTPAGGATGLGGPDNDYHRLVCPAGYALADINIYSADQLDGGIRANCVPLGTALSATNTWRSQNALVSPVGTGTNTQGFADNVTHFAQCASNEVATGLEIYANSRLDGQLKLRCTAVNAVTLSHPTGAGVLSAITIPYNTGQDNQFHFAGCPAGTLMRHIQIRATGSFLDGEIEVGCTGLRP